MPDLTPNQWLIVGLIFLLGVVIGMALRGGGKWKARYREEADLRREEVKRLEAENAQLRKETGELSSLRGAAARDEARRQVDEERGPL